MHTFWRRWRNEKGHRWETLQRCHPAITAVAVPAIRPLLTCRPAHWRHKGGNVPPPRRATRTPLHPAALSRLDVMNCPWSSRGRATSQPSQDRHTAKLESAQHPLGQKWLSLFYKLRRLRAERSRTLSKVHNKWLNWDFLTQIHLNFSKTPFIHSFIHLFMAALGLCCCTQAFSSCGERGLLFVAVRGLLIVVASLAAEHGL